MGVPPAKLHEKPGEANKSRTQGEQKAGFFDPVHPSVAALHHAISTSTRRTRPRPPAHCISTTVPNPLRFQSRRVVSSWLWACCCWRAFAGKTVRDARPASGHRRCGGPHHRLRWRRPFAERRHHRGAGVAERTWVPAWRAA